MPALLNETFDNLIDKFGGIEQLELAINSGQERVTNMIGVHNEYYHEEPEMLWGAFKALKEFFEMVLNERADYQTYIG